MMTFPAYLADFASVVHRLQLQAHFEKFGDLKIDERLNDANVAKELFERFIVLLGERNAKMQEARDDPAALVALAEDMIEKGGAITLIIAGAPAAINNFELAMMSYITSAWTMFETAASDLWEAALNHRPQGLADLNGEKRYQGRKNKRSDGDAPRLDKSVKLRLLRENDYDTKNRMGTILREKFAFTTLWGIREAYEAAFYEKSDDIDKVVMDECFDQLSALRNVIVHKSAIADTEYVQKTKDIQTLPKFQRGEKIQLNGKMVADLVHKTSMATFALLYTVDQWLVTNAPKAAADES